MAVEDIQQLLDLLALAPEVTELSVRGASGDKVTIKRAVGPGLADTDRFYEHGVDVDGSVEVSSAHEPGLPAPTISATMVGLFHNANPPIASGGTVVSGQIVGYIESMRLMNEVVSTVEGTVDVVIISDGQPVEYGQPLFALTNN